ncbi:Inactive dipeptidyl peptidase 10 [Liparis tanakae]|uniref:Inactive dipeptidyl peptidase 10 n=1 Tax=Liparis tanakae TaxID=230148 RepID=A0A4Z2GUM4_9TELE|nr:Inactive dipeptidyl peptidase 10 [Liparis tanakae]
MEDLESEEFKMHDPCVAWLNENEVALRTREGHVLSFSLSSNLTSTLVDNSSLVSYSDTAIREREQVSASIGLQPQTAGQTERPIEQREREAVEGHFSTAHIGPKQNWQSAGIGSSPLNDLTTTKYQVSADKTSVLLAYNIQPAPFFSLRAFSLALCHFPPVRLWRAFVLTEAVCAGN